MALGAGDVRRGGLEKLDALERGGRGLIMPILPCDWSLRHTHWVMSAQGQQDNGWCKVSKTCTGLPPIVATTSVWWLPW